MTPNHALLPGLPLNFVIYRFSSSPSLLHKTIFTGTVDLKSNIYIYIYFVFWKSFPLAINVFVVNSNRWMIDNDNKQNKDVQWLISFNSVTHKRHVRLQWNVNSDMSTTCSTASQATSSRPPGRPLDPRDVLSTPGTSAESGLWTDSTRCSAFSCGRREMR